jgi:hypothetical protein
MTTGSLSSSTRRMSDLPVPFEGSKQGGVMAKGDVPREKWIPEIPFDVAVWGDAPDMWPDGLFSSKKEREEAEAAAEDHPPRLPHPLD